MRFTLSASVLAVLLLPISLCAQGSTLVVPDSPKGFDRQYKRIFNAFADDNAQKMEQNSAEFAIPPHWFIDVFGPDRGPQLSEQYSELFQGFVATTEREFKSAHKYLYNGCRGSFDCRRISTKPAKTKTATQPDLKPAPAPLLPLPRVQQFMVRYESGPYRQNYHATTQMFALVAGKNDSWVDSFVYVDGAFRFFGGGAYPFWDPCSRNRVLAGGQRISHVAPVYPPTAHLRQPHMYAIKMRITVAKDGSVKNPEILKGEPVLLDSAREAVLQWRYEPFMNCGEPVEKQLIIFVDFFPKSRFTDLIPDLFPQ